MATLNVIGKSLIASDDFFIKKFSGELTSLNKLDITNVNPIINFNNTSIPLNTLSEDTSLIGREFTPIGLGKPLSIEIATVYTGEYKRWFLGGKKDVLVVSGVKNSQTFQATSRAINIKSKNVNENDYLDFSAFEDGTKFVYYSPAMDASSTIVSFEIMFDNFDTTLFDKISSLLNSAAGIPVFIPASTYLLGGSQLIKIAAESGNTLFAGHPKLSGSITIEFDSPIIPRTEPKEFVIYNDGDKPEFDNLEVALFEDSPKLRLVNKSDRKEYKGSAPYLIIILNGAKRQDLENFSPTIASASILKKFYGASDPASDVTVILQNAMQLYNDSMYRQKGEKLQKQMKDLAKESEEYKKLLTLYEAYSKNIQSESFKLPQIPSE